MCYAIRTASSSRHRPPFRPVYEAKKKEEEEDEAKQNTRAPQTCFDMLGGKGTRRIRFATSETIALQAQWKGKRVSETEPNTP